MKRRTLAVLLLLIVGTTAGAEEKSSHWSPYSPAGFPISLDIPSGSAIVGSGFYFEGPVVLSFDAAAMCLRANGEVLHSFDSGTPTPRSGRDAFLLELQEQVRESAAQTPQRRLDEAIAKLKTRLGFETLDLEEVALEDRDWVRVKFADHGQPILVDLRDPPNRTRPEDAALEFGRLFAAGCESGAQPFVYFEGTGVAVLWTGENATAAHRVFRAAAHGYHVPVSEWERLGIQPTTLALGPGPETTSEGRP